MVKALNRIGATRTMEDYIAFILSIAGEDDTLTPCYGIVPSRRSDRMDRAGPQGL